MSKARVAVLHVVSGRLTVTAAAKTYGLSRQHLHRLLKRCREGGLEAVDSRSRRPASNPRAVSDDVIIALVGLREQLSVDVVPADTNRLLELPIARSCRRCAAPSSATCSAR
jgi:transposase-like protein